MVYFILLCLLFLLLILVRTYRFFTSPSTQDFIKHQSYSTKLIDQIEKNNQLHLKHQVKLNIENTNDVHHIPFDLITIDNTPAEKIKTLNQQVNKIRRPPGVFHKLTSDAYSLKEYASLVSNDALVAARILKVVNSSSYYLTKKISSVQHAVIFLGASTVRNLAIEASFSHAFEHQEKSMVYAFNHFWVMGFIASTLSLWLAQAYQLEQPSRLSTQSLLSFIGNLVYCAEYPTKVDHYIHCNSLQERVEWEQELNQSNSAVLGSLLARAWQLPNAVVKNIEHSLDMLNTPVEQFEGQNVREYTLSYICCRMAEMLIHEDIPTITEIDLAKIKHNETIYLQDYIAKANFKNLQFHLNNRNLILDLKKIISLLERQK